MEVEEKRKYMSFRNIIWDDKDSLRASKLDG